MTKVDTRALLGLLPPELDGKGWSALETLAGLPAGQREALRALLVRARRQGRADERQARARRRLERRTEHSTFAAAQQRMLAAAGRRAADDLPALVALVAFRDQIATLEQLAVDGLRGQGYSWAQIGAALGITRQSAWERFARQGEPDTEPAAGEVSDAR